MVGGDWEDTIYFAIITIHWLFLVTSSLVLLSYLVKSIDYVRVLRNPRPIGKAYFGNRQTNERSLYRCLFDKVSFRFRGWILVDFTVGSLNSKLFLYAIFRQKFTISGLFSIKVLILQAKSWKKFTIYTFTICRPYCNLYY